MIAVEILAPVAGRDLKHEERRGVITVKLWWIETQDGAFLLVFHDVMASIFKFGGNRRFLGVDRVPATLVVVARKLPSPTTRTTPSYHLKKNSIGIYRTILRMALSIAIASD